MDSNALGVGVVPRFEKFLRTETSLTVLNLSNCGLDAEAVSLISDALINNAKTRINKLFIDNNNIGVVGAKALARYFATFDELEVLEISGC